MPLATLVNPRMSKQQRIKGRATDPRQRVPGGEFEQLVHDLGRARDAKAQRKRTGFGPEALVFIRKPAPKRKPLALLFGTVKQRP